MWKVCKSEEWEGWVPEEDIPGTGNCFCKVLEAETFKVRMAAVLQRACGEVATDKGVKVDEGQVTQEIDHTCHTKETKL